MESNKCDCLSSSHQHGTPCGKPVVFRVKMKERPQMVGLCKECLTQPFAEISIGFYDDSQ
jgi:hypothetical protein